MTDEVELEKKLLRLERLLGDVERDTRETLHRIEDRLDSIAVAIENMEEAARELELHIEDALDKLQAEMANELDKGFVISATVERN